ncbi:hypothetical protein NW762_012056 [Fusarium torreyae]|uniref:Chitin-binding type-2 domain-containing protein n=1 Tax=Fusarium torreyae TaxID=1237075 RepID=A0A9W8VBZ7_9HYPO|nr:hypothetical protein NW762_012056 [Fusarium torreyae]
MKVSILVAALTTSVKPVLANDLIAMEAPVDTWCITYLSTYLATITNQGSPLPSDEPDDDGPTTQDSVEQCQNGRLIGVDGLTSSSSVTAVSEVPNTKGIATTEQSLSTQSSVGMLPALTDLEPSEWMSTASEKSELEASATPSSDSTESFVSFSQDATAISASESSTQGEAASQGESIFTDLDDTTELSSMSTISGESTIQPRTASTTQLSTETAHQSDTTVASADETGLSTTSVMIFHTTTEIGTSETDVAITNEDTVTEPEDPTTTETDTVAPTTNKAETTIVDKTTTAEPEESTATETEPETSSTPKADPPIRTTTEASRTTMDTITTAEAEQSTTTEAGTTPADTTTTAESTTTTEAASEPQPQFACGDDGYTSTYTYNGVTFNLICESGFSYFPLFTLWGQIQDTTLRK